MSFTWVNNDVATSSVTIYDSNLTLNKNACQYFDNIRYVLLGIDYSTDQIAIKPVSVEEVNLKIYPSEELHKISIGKSYGRISNKQFIQMISKRYNFDFDVQNGYKYDAKFDSKEHLLIIQL